jgi:hypothetical protein
MTEKQNEQVSGVPTPEIGLPQPKFSEQEPASPTSPLSEKVSTFSEKQLEQLDTLFERKLQSTKDKRFQKLEELSGQMEMLAQIKEAGGTVPEALENQIQMRDFISRELAARGVTPNSDKSMSGVGVSKSDNFNVVEELTKRGLSTNDPDVIKLVQDSGTGKFQNPDQMRVAMADLAIQKLKSPASSDALSSAPVGGVASVNLDEAQKSEKYSKLDALYKNPTTNKEAIKSLEKELGMS